MESISARKVGLAFLAALLAFALMPLAGLAYADTPAGETGLSDTEATEEVASSEPSSETAPETSPAPSEADAQNTASSDGIDLRGPADATVTNFAELQAAISTITGDSDPTGTIIIDGDFSFDSMIEVTVPCVITIQGGNHTLTATATRHFQFTGGANVTITDAVFDGGTTGGGINVLNGGELALERTTIQNCSAPSGQGGGALRTYGNTVALAVKVTISDNCVFKDNIANALNPHNAGALEIRQNTTFAMSDSSFEGNTARGVGGAVYVIGASPTQMADATFTNVTFDRNESIDSQGGGIAIKDYANVAFDQCSFTNNKAYSSGGGLFTDRYCDITIKNSEFLNNIASGSYYASAGGLGVSLYNHAITKFTMTGTTVDGNYSKNGGGITFNTFTNYEISDCTITNNTATAGGGGIHVGSAVGGTDPVSLTVKNSTVSGNTAEYGGGLFGGQYNTYNSQIKLEGTTVSNNTATKDGGGVNMEDATLTTLYADAATVFSGNKAATLHKLADPALIATHAANIHTSSFSTPYVSYAYSNYDVNQTMGPEVETLGIARLFGDERYKTAKQVATYERDISAEQTLIIASGHDSNFPDALAASALSGANSNAPILLTDPASLSAPTREVLEQATSATKVYIIGDTPSVSSAVESEIASVLSGAQIVRLGGESRMETAELIYNEIAGQASSTAIIARSMDFPDSLSASSWAAFTTSPIFLTDFSEQGLTQGTLDALANGSFDRVLVLGSELSVPQSVADAACDAAGITDADVVRLAGEDRVGTSLAMAEWATSADRDPAEQLTWDNLAVTRADSHSDALSGGSLQGKQGAAMVLTWTSFVDPGVLAAITAAQDGISEIRFFGDENSVSLDTMRAYIKAIQFEAPDWKPDESVAFDLD